MIVEKKEISASLFEKLKALADKVNQAKTPGDMNYSMEVMELSCEFRKQEIIDALER